jgi:hypothetical protein
MKMMNLTNICWHCIMSLQIEELYHKYETIIKYSTFAFAGWFLSWVLFFIMLPGMIRIFGKVKGGFLNYAFSWISMFLIIVILSITINGKIIYDKT